MPTLGEAGQPSLLFRGFRCAPGPRIERRNEDERGHAFATATSNKPAPGLRVGRNGRLTMRAGL
jgi:hypothetical protein